jgi:16S rRNA (cytidine1402-2'-O)-methyltransferase
VLYIVGSPIGNLSDISLRALEVLRQVNRIAAEDTRRIRILLNHYEIEKPLLSFHEFNEAKRTAEIVQYLEQGESIALVSDAGMPSISDPGLRLITRCQQNQIPFTVIPGPSAVTTGLVGSGLPTDKFYFGGFLPSKSGQRERELRAALQRECSSIYFESPYRLLKTLEALNTLEPACQICVARELTKHFEEFRRGTVSEIRDHYAAHSPKGEITLIISNNERQKLVGRASESAGSAQDRSQEPESRS